MGRRKVGWMHGLLISAAMATLLAAGLASTAGAASFPNRPPFVVHFSWGTFRLNPTIAEKVLHHQPINYVFSYQGTGIPLFSQQYYDGFVQGCKAGNKIYPLNCTSIAPVQTNADQQISQIEAALAAGKIDCISIEPTTTNGFTQIQAQLIAKGIPVFTVGVTSFGRQFTNYTQIPLKEGYIAAKTVLAYMQVHHLHFKYFAVSGGDPTQYWAQGRMTGFMRTIKAAIPDAVFLNTPTTAINTTYDPSTMYSQAKAFILGHPQVQVIENSDIGAEEIDRVISDLGKKGKIFTVGWNVTPGNLSYIDKGIQIGTMDQQWGAQAAFGGTACAEFLAHGKVLPNTQKETAVTQAAVASLLSREGLLSQSTTIARKEINRFLSSH